MWCLMAQKIKDILLLRLHLHDRFQSPMLQPVEGKNLFKKDRKSDNQIASLRDLTTVCEWVFTHV